MGKRKAPRRGLGPEAGGDAPPPGPGKRKQRKGEEAAAEKTPRPKPKPKPRPPATLADASAVQVAAQVARRGGPHRRASRAAPALPAAAAPAPGAGRACGAPAKRELDDDGVGADPLVLEWEEEAEWEEAEAAGAPSGRGLELTVTGAAAGAGEAAGAKKRRPVTARDREWAKQVHRAHLLCLLARALQLDCLASDRVTQALVRSLIPLDLDPRTYTAAAMLRPVVAWFRQTFACVREPDGPPDLDLGLEARVRRALEARRGPAEVLCALFVALLRGAGFAARLVAALAPLPRKPAAALAAYHGRLEREQQAAAEEAAGVPQVEVKDGKIVLKGGSLPKRQRRKGSDAALAAALTPLPKTPDHPGAKGKGKAKKVAEQPVAHLWAEVYVGTGAHAQWVHLDPVQGRVDQPEGVERAQDRGGPLVYVLGLLEGGAKDVTRRYACDFLKAARERDTEWWGQTVQPLLRREPARFDRYRPHYRGGEEGAEGGGGGGPPTVDLTVPSPEEREEAELKRRWEAKMKADWPKSQAAAKDHPLYCLPRLLTKSQILAPGARPAGKFVKGEPLYWRKDVSELRTADGWVREGRQVKAAERASPARVTKRKESSKKAGDADPKGVPLFGAWQTEAWKPEVAKDGKVPKNEYGNVLCPPFVPSVPEGTVHLRLPRLGAICKRLEIDFAPAMLGFERQSGRVYPVIEGVVVCREYEALILDAFAAAEAVRHEKALRGRAREAARQWQQLLEVMAARQKLEDEFRGPAAPRAAAVPAPVAAPGAGAGAPLKDKGKARAVPGVQTVVHEDGFAMEIEEI